MKVLCVAAGLALVLAMAGCGESDSEAEAAPTMPDVIGLQLDIALGDIESAGFEEEVDVASDGTFGVIQESNWTVCDQMPKADQEVTATPKLTVDRSCGDGDSESATPSTETEPETAPTEPPATVVPDEVLTAATSAEFAAILTEDYCSDTVEGFASTYRGRTIEFDGHVAARADDGETRYDILVSAGDFAGSSGDGPAFQFRDVGTSDLNLTGSDIPASIGLGDNLHVVAQVQDYEPASCLFLLDPVSTALR